MDGVMSGMPHEVWADCLSMSESCAADPKWERFDTVLLVLVETEDPRGAAMSAWLSYSVAAMGADRALEILHSPPPGEAIVGLMMRLGSQLPVREAEAVGRIRQLHERMEARGVVEAAEDAERTTRWLYQSNPALDADERKRVATQRGGET